MVSSSFPVPAVVAQLMAWLAVGDWTQARQWVQAGHVTAHAWHGRCPALHEARHSQKVAWAWLCELGDPMSPSPHDGRPLWWHLAQRGWANAAAWGQQHDPTHHALLAQRRDRQRLEALLETRPDSLSGPLAEALGEDWMQRTDDQGTPLWHIVLHVRPDFVLHPPAGVPWSALDAQGLSAWPALIRPALNAARSARKGRSHPHYAALAEQVSPEAMPPQYGWALHDPTLPLLFHHHSTQAGMGFVLGLMQAHPKVWWKGTASDHARLAQAWLAPMHGSPRWVWVMEQLGPWLDAPWMTPALRGAMLVSIAQRCLEAQRHQVGMKAVEADALEQVERIMHHPIALPQGFPCEVPFFFSHIRAHLDAELLTQTLHAMPVATATRQRL